MKYINRLIIILSVILVSGSLFAQKVNIDRVDPPFWWAGMKNTHLQLMVYGEKISTTHVSIDYAGVKINKVIQVESPNYLFIDLLLDKDINPGTFDIKFKIGKKVKATYAYELKKRDLNPKLHNGFDNSDVIYLLMPDRFSNGNPDNDDMPNMLEKANRDNPNGRHGGDIKGISNKLTYFNNLGVTALWINPLLENNMPEYSYHGYAVTDLYKIDPRFGTNNDYVNLVEDAHSQDIKIIMDMIFNHLGTEYFWKNDLPMSDWYNQWPEFTRSNYRGGVVSDPHSSEYDYNKMVKGWFDVTMADLNQENDLMANYLIQNSIWWIEYAKLDGIRQDTYPYPYKDFMAHWMERVLEEYPNFNVVGEVWLSYPAAVSYWQNSNTNKDDYKSHLTNVFDFPLMYAISKAFNEPEGWSTGTAELYEIISQDFVYNDANSNVVFADNHDGDRFYSKVGKDIDKFKLAMAFLMTTRGTPQIYYGTEILMDGEEHNGHGDIRKDFPGGWKNDKNNAFTKEGRTDEQNNAFNFMRRLLNWRRTNATVQYGKLTHYIPEDGVYVYFKKLNGNTVMVMLNNTNDNKKVNMSRFAVDIGNNTKGKGVLTRKVWDDLSSIEVPAKSPLIIELSK